jgi:hypothetical protein
MLACYRGIRTLGAPRENCEKAQRAFEDIVASRVQQVLAKHWADESHLDTPIELAHLRVARLLASQRLDELLDRGVELGAAIYTEAEYGYMDWRKLRGQASRSVPVDPSTLPEKPDPSSEPSPYGLTDELVLALVPDATGTVLQSFQDDPPEGVDAAFVERFLRARVTGQPASVRAIGEELGLTQHAATMALTRARAELTLRGPERGLTRVQVWIMTRLLRPDKRGRKPGLMPGEGGT